MVALLLLLVVLGSRAPAAAATATTMGLKQCEPDVLAKRVSAVCAPGKATARCCDEVINLSCLCPVAAESRFLVAGLDATLLQLYSTCVRDTRAAADIATACAGALPKKSNDGTTIRINAGASKLEECDSRRLGRNLVTACQKELNSPSSTCCDSMFTVIGHGSRCLCNVTWESSFKMSTFVRNNALLNLYGNCGGDPSLAAYLHLQDSCAEQNMDEAENVCQPGVAPFITSFMWVGWGLAFFLFTILVATVLVLRRSKGARIYTARILAGNEIRIEELDDEEDGAVLLRPLGRAPLALPHPGSNNHSFLLSYLLGTLILSTSYLHQL